MINILIVYTSSFSNTERMTELVTDGMLSIESTEVICKEASEATVDARVKKFIEEVCDKLWLTDEMVGKPANLIHRLVLES